MIWASPLATIWDKLHCGVKLPISTTKGKFFSKQQIQIVALQQYWTDGKKEKSSTWSSRVMLKVGVMLRRQPGIWWCCPLAEQSAHGASIFTATFIWKSICPWLNYLLVRLLLNPLSSVGVNSGICICLRNSICVLFLVYPYNSKKMPTVNLRCISICFYLNLYF